MAETEDRPAGWVIFIFIVSGYLAVITTGLLASLFPDPGPEWGYLLAIPVIALWCGFYALLDKILLMLLYIAVTLMEKITDEEKDDHQ